MIKTVSVYDKEKIKEISKPLATKSLVVSAVISAILLVFGVIIFVKSIIAVDVLNIVLSSLTILFAIYPTYRTIRQNKQSLAQAIREMGIDKCSITITLLVRDKRIEVTTEQNGVVKNSTVLIRNVSEIKTNKQAVGIYVKDNMYYVLNSDYIEGNRQELLNVFKKAGTKIKGK